MRDQQMTFGIMAVRIPQLLERPCPRLDAVVALHVLVPFEGTNMRAVAEERKFRRVAVQEDHVVVAARARTSAPFGSRKGDEAAVAVDLFEIMAVRIPQLLERPCPRLDAVVALHVLVPFEGTNMRAVAEERKFRRVAVQEDHVVVAARARTSAPFGSRKGDEAAVAVDLL